MVIWARSFPFSEKSRIMNTTDVRIAHGFLIRRSSFGGFALTDLLVTDVIGGGGRDGFRC
jgi:hypothetical protein